MSQNVNPLKQFFRQPAIYLRLPSGGKFWPNGSLNMPPNQELPVLPMTAVDEIIYRTPDALFNGSVVVNVIQSCIPNILNAWQIPSNDLNAILIAIRIASYGADMEIETGCPHCSHQDGFVINLNSMLDSMPRADFDQVISQGDLEFYFQPTSYELTNRVNLFQFEQQKTLQQLQETDLSDEQRLDTLTKTLQQVTDLTIKAISYSVAGIRTPNALVSEQEYIEDFLKNCDSTVFSMIRDHVVKLRVQTEIPPLNVTCSNCNKPFEQALILDSANFFADAS